MINKLIITRKNWCRGRNPTLYGITKLLNNEGNMCCLGFLGKAALIPDELLLNISGPGNLKVKDKYPVPRIGFVSYNEFMELNDSDMISEEQREKELIELFKQELNIDLEFQD